MSQIELLLRALHEPLAIHPEYGRHLASLLARKMAGESFGGAAIHAALNLEARGPQAHSNPAAGIAVIPIYGVIAQHPQSLGISTDEIDAMLTAAVNSRSVEGIFFDVDSPGGTIPGVPELAAKIREAGSVKPTAGIANGTAASAAYWLLSQVQDVTVLGSGMGAGSIGVYTIHEDISKALEAKGITATPISAGTYKLEGSELGPLTEEAKAVLQGRVNEAYGWIVRDVALGRKDTQTAVRNGYGEGRMLSASQSVKANLADRVGTFEEAIQRLVGRVGRQGSSGGARSAAWRERELALDGERGVS